MILLDTHALLWWALDPGQLSTAAAEACAELEREGGYASSISIWELGIKVKRGKLELGLSLDEFVRHVVKSAAVELVPVDTEVWLRSLALEWDHADPADRVIVATALLKGVPVLTKDRLIQSFDGVRCVW